VPFPNRPVGHSERMRSRLSPRQRAGGYIAASLATAGFLCVFGIALGAKAAPLVLVSTVGMVVGGTVASGWVTGGPVANRRAIREATQRLGWSSLASSAVYGAEVALLLLGIVGLVVAYSLTH
jgi:hypothetical protein